MSQVKLKDVLHLYLGCEIQNSTDAYRGTLLGVQFPCNAIIHCDYFNKSHKIPDSKQWGEHIFILEKMKPFLRSLDSMTDEESIELVKLSQWESYGDNPHNRIYECYKNNFGKTVVSWGESGREKNIPLNKTAYTIQEFQYLLKNSFDLFNLIPSGQAIQN